MKRIIAFILMVVVCFSLAACGSQKKINEDIIVEKDFETEEVKTESSEKMYSVYITYFDVAANENVSKEIELPEASPINIANAVLKELGDNGTKINNVWEQRGNIYIDFSGDSTIFRSGSAGELAVLDSLAMTFVEDLGYDNIFYSKDGGTYESGHIVLEEDEPYM